MNRLHLVLVTLVAALVVVSVGQTVTLTKMRAQIADLEHREPVPGPRGPIGPQGPQGPQGPEGEPGLDGADGRANSCLQTTRQVVTDVQQSYYPDVDGNRRLNVTKAFITFCS